MLISNPVRASYRDIREKYDGYCVLVVNCDYEKMDFGTGMVVAYHEDMAALVEETAKLTDGDVGIFGYEAFSNIGCAGPVQVVHHG